MSSYIRRRTVLGWGAAAPTAVLPTWVAARPAAPLAAMYAQPGPDAARRQDVLDADGRKLYAVWAPVERTTPRPIVAWGNGTGSNPETYAALLAHFASWGFVAVDSFNRNVGSGRAILDSIVYLAQSNADPGHPLYGRLDLGRVGVAGTSQGAVGVINAATQWPESPLVRTVCPNALPDVGTGSFFYDTGLLQVPTFFTAGTRDKLISPVRVNRAAFDAMPAAVPALRSMVKGADHIEVEDDGGAYRGYLTAWMRWQLTGDVLAARAFEGPKAEVLRNEAWTNTEIRAI